MAEVACVRGGCVCSWINGVEKSREHFVSERVRFCNYWRVVDCCGSGSGSGSSSSSSVLSWPFLSPVIMCSTSSRESRVQQPLRKRNTRAANPCRQQGSSQVVTGARISVSDLDLVTALHEFIAAGDLPPHQVPSTRDLARSGRQDLANAVRRRGYKLVAQLLANPNFLKTSNSESVQAQPSSGVSEHETTHQEHDIQEQVQQHAHIYQSPGRIVNGYASFQQINGLGLERGPSSFVPHSELVVENEARQTILQRDCAISETPLETAISTPSLLSPREGRPKSYSNQRTGLMNEEDQAIDIFGTQQLESHQRRLTQPNMAEHTQGAGKFNNRSNNGVHAVHANEHSSDDKGLQSNPASDFSDSQEIAWQKAAMLTTKLQSFFSNPIEKTMVQKPRDQDAHFDGMAKEEESLKSASPLQENEDIQTAPRTDLSTELDCIKALLHAKEMENLRVVRELDKVKALLALIRVKAAAEVVQAKQQAAEKDLQLRLAQQALHSLKMVHVDWWGEGKRIELAGSFNGWEHHLCLFPDLASESPKRDGSRGPMMWSVELWLYPGVYEIKFIVDGKWQIDHRREVVHHHIGPNNLLQVDP